MDETILLALEQYLKQSIKDNKALLSNDFYCANSYGVELAELESANFYYNDVLKFIKKQRKLQK